MVAKGIWQSRTGPMNVAVKTLKEQASEEDKIKFLQEAAINGQFHHPNIIQLFGVVTVGEPVSRLVLSGINHIHSVLCSIGNDCIRNDEQWRYEEVLANTQTIVRFPITLLILLFPTHICFCLTDTWYVI